MLNNIITILPKSVPVGEKAWDKKKNKFLALFCLSQTQMYVEDTFQTTTFQHTKHLDKFFIFVCNQFSTDLKKSFKYFVQI